MKDREKKQDIDKEIRDSVERTRIETRIARAAQRIRNLREAREAGHLDPSESAALRDMLAWLSPEELEEAERRANQADELRDPQTMPQDLLGRLPGRTVEDDEEEK